MKIKLMYVLILLVSFTACSEDETELLIENNSNTIPTIELETDALIELDEDALSFGSKESLADFLENKNEAIIENTLDDLKSRGFASLSPTFDDLEGPEVDKFLAEKSARIASKGKLYSSKGNSEDISLDDELISDSKFAKVLNVDRGIIVGKKYYVYTMDGVYFCKKKHRKLLNKYLKKLSSDKSFVPSSSKADDCAQQKSASKNEAMSLSPVSGKVTSITSEISRYTAGCGGGGSGGGSGGTTTSPSDAASIPLIKPMSFGSCSYSQDSVWQQVFGRRIKCYDYHDNTHRVKTEFWNQNYLVYASIGSKVIYQKKRWLGWSKSSTAEFVELGLNSVKYTWNHPKQYNPFSDVHIKYKYKGVTYRSDGTQTYDAPVNPTAWPYDNQKDDILIPIYIQIDDILGNDKWFIKYRGVKGSDINRAIKDLLKSASKLIPTNTGFQEDMRRNNIDVKIMRYAPNETNVIVSNRIKRQTDGDAYFRFDLNFLLSFNSKEKKILQLLAGQIGAKKYTNVEVDLYGAAYRNGVIKGKRITGKD